MNIIEVKDLEFEYKNYDDDGNETEPNKVLKGINLSIPKGQFVAVLGHNGCGKSTLAKHFNGILTATKGQVLVNGIDAATRIRIRYFLKSEVYVTPWAMPKANKGKDSRPMARKPIIVGKNTAPIWSISMVNAATHWINCRCSLLIR